MWVESMISGRWFITPHAVRRFMERAVRGATYEEALEPLITASETARLIRVVGGTMTHSVQLFQHYAKSNFHEKSPVPNGLRGAQTEHYESFALVLV
jgi:hypothetical protein